MLLGSAFQQRYVNQHLQSLSAFLSRVTADTCTHALPLQLLHAPRVCSAPAPSAAATHSAARCITHLHPVQTDPGRQRPSPRPWATFALMAQIHSTRSSCRTLGQFMQNCTITRLSGPFAVFHPSIPLTSSISVISHLLSESYHGLRTLCAQPYSSIHAIHPLACHSAFRMGSLPPQKLHLASARSPR